MISITLIDDDGVMNTLNRKMIEKRLGKENCEITEFTDPEEAVTHLIGLDKLPDYIFLDIIMPLMNGWEVLEILEEELGTLDLDTNLIMATSSLMPEDKMKAMAIPCVKHYIHKPIDTVSVHFIFQD